MENPVAIITPSKATLSFGFKLFIWLLVMGLIAGFVYWFFFLKKISWKEVKRLISQESSKHTGKEVATERILLQGAKEIISHPHLIKQARDFATSSKIAIERVIVDNAIAMAKNLGYIAVSPASPVNPAPGPAQPSNTSVQ